MCNDPTCGKFQPVKVNIPALMAVYCQQTKVINPFDTFVCQNGVHIPGVMQPGYHEIVVKEVAADGGVMANMYRIEDGKRVFDQEARFLPPNGLIQMVHMGLFIPQSFFYQFTGVVAVEDVEEPPTLLA